MKILILFSLLICSSMILNSCSEEQEKENIKNTILLTKKMNSGDTIGVRSLFADSIQNFFFTSLINTFSAETEVNNILISGINDGFYQIDQIIESSNNHVTFSTKEFPGYLYNNIINVDTIQYLMTYYFKNNKIYQTRTDTFNNMLYCYTCIDQKSNLHLSEFFSWINQNHPKIDSILNNYYKRYINGEQQNSLEVLKSEQLQKEYFKLWESIE